MKPPPFAYARAESTADVLELLAADEDAKVLAGGQSLVPMLNFRFARPSTLVDVTYVEALQSLERDKGHLSIGATVPQLVAERSPLVGSDCPLIAQALGHVGHVQIRSRGTVGGSLAHADPAAELPAVALALDATLVVLGQSGERTIPAGEFFQGPYMTALDDTELLVAARFPVLDATRTAFVEYSRRSGDFAEGAVAAALTFDGQTVSRARLAATGVGSGPLRLTAAEDRLTGKPLTEDAVEAAAGEVALEGQAYDAGARAYKTALLRALVARSLRQVMR
ncbi:MAG: aerobic carbon-monoxide dehydrogenase medium subunit [Thermoleophilaceae bacterium]|nr:aerobic carbon-monoxide dehydrogenase medium subunit [Thermoleophilaceae bacterium]